jgi:4-aminobutyrate aminotransferase-like enzyme
VYRGPRLCLGHSRRGGADEVAPKGLGHVLFTTGGTEAIEHAVRMARLHNGRPKMLAAYRSYHGSTTTSIHLTGDPRRWASDTRSGRRPLFGPFQYRSAFGSSTSEEEYERALAQLAQVILLEGPSTISALVMEAVTGSSGVIVPPAGYLREVRELCTRHDIVFIADEVLVGFGRTGAWFGVDHDGVARRWLRQKHPGLRSGLSPYEPARCTSVTALSSVPMNCRPLAESRRSSSSAPASAESGRS